MTPLPKMAASLWVVGGHGRQRSYPSFYGLACVVARDLPLMELSSDPNTA